MKSENRPEPFVPESELGPADLPDGVDRRAFMMRSAIKYKETSEGGLAVSVVLC